MKGIRLTITMTEDGVVSVNGPMDNKILCYGLLEAGRDIVRAHTPAEEPRVSLPPAGLVFPR